MKQQIHTISEFPLPESLPSELQVIADIISLPETLKDAERTISPDMFTDDRCRDAFVSLTKMSKEGMLIDLPSCFSRIDRDLLKKGIIPMMNNTGGVATANQHFSTLKEMHIKRRCYFKAIEMLQGSTDSRTPAQDLIGKVGTIAESLRKEIDADRGTQHVSDALNDLGTQIEKATRLKAEGKVLRVPSGIYSLDFLTYGGFNAGNLVILAARPSVGKTAIMLQMARAAACSGKSVNLFNLEMTNTELVQRFLFSTGIITPIQIAKGEVEWKAFETASSQFSDKPIYLNDSAYRFEDIRARILIHSQSGKCDIAFIDYLGLIRRQGNSAYTLAQSIGEITTDLKNLAKECNIPIVLLCQLNRASASEKRPPQLFDLRDSGNIEQDADIVLMLERDAGDEDGRNVNMWVRKNRQGKAGDVKVELEANETFTVFTDKNDPMQKTPVPEHFYGSQSSIDFTDNNFDNDSDLPF